MGGIISSRTGDAAGGHTAGPWAIRRGHSVVEVRTVAGLEIAATTGGDYWKNFSDEALANARLIAAAPELLAALREAIELLDDCEISHPLRWETIIAKAEGR